MRAGFRQSMAWMHTWAGLLVCWVLFLVFCGGTASYYREEITYWMKPELHRVGSERVTPEVAAENAVRYLEANAADAQRWFISLPDERRNAISLFWNPKPKADATPGGRRRFEQRLLDPATGKVIDSARETRGGEFLYRLHFDLHYMPALWARWIVSFCAMFMLAAIISGVITHRRIFQDFFTFRSRKGQRSWLDAHNATAVLALPFHLMITYTGLVSLLFMLMPWGIQSAYKGDQQAFAAEGRQRPLQPKPAGQAAGLVPVGPLMAQAREHWGGVPAGRLTVMHPGDANATMTLTRAKTKELSADSPSVVFGGTTGKQLATLGDERAPADDTRGVMVGLHVAHFAPDALRALFFLCGLGGCAMVATGALLWAVKTRQSYAKRLAAGGRIGFGLRLVEALNIGAIAGLPIAFATYFWANRLLPVGMPVRTDWEIRCFFGAWAIAALLAQFRPTRMMWRLQLWAAAMLFGGIPLLNAVTTTSHLGVTLLRGEGPVSVASFDLVMLAFGLGFAYAAHWLGRKKAPAGNKAAKPAANATKGTPVASAGNTAKTANGVTAARTPATQRQNAEAGQGVATASAPHVATSSHGPRAEGRAT